MKIRYLIAAFGITLVLVQTNLHNARAADEAASVHSYVERAVSPNPKTANAAIQSLRAIGPAGLEALLAANTNLIASHASKSTAAAWARLEHALDEVSGQRDCQVSHLFWYTNFDEAKAVAKLSGKPILSLRLLGKLDEEYSCANSRFFRTTLYANTEVSKYLRDNFILHWKSVRPVPRITIDFGDGRKIERTITGNSIHYILDAEGRVVDALPGLYGPKAFLKYLGKAHDAAVSEAHLAEAERTAFLKQYHKAQYAANLLALNNDVASLHEGAQPIANLAFATPGSATPTAFVAGKIALTKAGVEMPMLKSFQKGDGKSSMENLDDATWSRLAALHPEDAALDSSSRGLLRSKAPTASDSARLTASKSVVEDPLNRALRNLERSIAEDTVRNEYSLHSQLHQWFISGSAPRDIDALNQLVYAQLFLTPDWDPWLGLVPQNTITALNDNGLIIPTTTH